MKTIILATLALGACTTDYRSMTMAITDRPARLRVESSLEVPDECPIYSPRGGDIDTPELPYPSPMFFGCGVDSTGATWGLVNGDAGNFATLEPNREIGIFVAWESSGAADSLTVEQFGLEGPSPELSASAYVLTHEGSVGPKQQLPLKFVAFGPTGMLFSLGEMGPSPRAQVDLQMSHLFPNLWPASSSYNWQFFVSGY